MTFYPYALKLKANDSEELLEITALKNDEMLVKIGEFVTSSLISADQINNINFPSPVTSTQIATKEYVDSLSRLAVITVTSDYEIKLSDRVILGDASAGVVFLDLPSAVGQSGLLFNIKRISSGDNDLIIRTAPGETLDGESAIPLLLLWESMTVVSNGVSWYIM
jgi:hypothetical protein